jgi:hypothetical protein
MQWFAGATLIIVGVFIQIKHRGKTEQRLGASARYTNTVNSKSSRLVILSWCNGCLSVPMRNQIVPSSFSYCDVLIMFYKLPIEVISLFILLAKHFYHISLTHLLCI